MEPPHYEQGGFTKFGVNIRSAWLSLSSFSHRGSGCRCSADKAGAGSEAAQSGLGDVCVCVCKYADCAL